MACRRCGSAWVTHSKGLDMLSCPECCKQQRVKARKQGRMPKEIVRPCDICGKQMTISGSAICSTKYCEACGPQATRQRIKRCKERARRGEAPRTTKQLSRPRGECLNCGSILKSGQKKYCSPACFVAARNAGIQSWDRTGQLQANVNRCGIQLCPSKQGLSRVLNGFSGFMAKLRAFHRRISSLHCLTCDAIATERSRFCSDECRSEYQFTGQCNRCGCEMVVKGLRNGRRLCKACKLIAKKHGNDRRKKKYGRNHRQRARRYGVEYVAFPVRIVLERDGYVCQICRRKVLPKVMYRKKDGKIHPRSPTLDHIISMSKGGPHTPENCQCACFICNSRKGAKPIGQLRLPVS